MGNTLVNSNEITDFRYGIHAMNTPGIRIGSDLNDDPFPNSIKFNLGATPGISDLYAGIRLQRCDGAFVTGDNFSNSLPDIENDVEVSSTGLTNFRGIDIENSRDTRINCNVIRNLPRSITFTGHCERNLLRNNRMSGYENAIELYGAYITDQFQVDGSGDQPTDNQWLDANSDLRVSGSFMPIDPVNWYYKTSDQKYDPDPTLASTSILLRVPGSGTVVCDDYSDQRTRDELFGDVVYDSLEFAEYVDENTYYARMNTYLAMENDTSILYLNELSDTTYQNFYFGMQSLNVGELARVNELSVYPDSVLTAISINDAVSEDNDIEFNKKTVNHIYLNTFAIDSSLSGTDSTTLEAIAYMNWYQAGDVIYTAASMLFLEIQPSVPSSRLFAPNTMINPTYTAEIQSVIAVPNPAQDFVVLNGINSAFKVVEFYDTKNNLLKSISGDIRGEEVSLDFAPGIYFIKVTDEANIVYFKKIAIIR
ncbi:MAG: T9SS type A sorting domain-containing protein [Bacteroidetes bacterium]|nr:T9SS type A sorting domain-containing protein [Bacteroidota bacterium]